MSKLYVFAIGGSGSRVLRSLTMLLSSGVHTDYEIVPMIVDPDQSNGDLVRTVDIMRSYENIIRKSKFPQNPKRSVRFSGKRTKRSVQKRKARNTQKAETKVL